ncbi:DUF1156 domain-containing protein [Nitrospira sp. T9]|uniref:DUF1156 domain-containing protein n=1 Tax=unclassified Nitrospira TaxID=2652172 RepID=UPI003F9A06E4
MIEKNFDISLVASMALREKQIQQNYRPIIAVHKWFARRPGTLFRSLLLSEFTKGPLRERYFETNNLKGIRVADPFMGGGTPLVEANRLGCEVLGYDINPMAYWIVRQEIEYLDLHAYHSAAFNLTAWLKKKIGELYRTRCLLCGTKDAHVKYFLWVKIQECKECHKDFDLFSGYLLSEDRRHPLNVFVCPVCGELNEAKNRQIPGNCHSCDSRLSLSGPAKRNRCNCPHCGVTNIYQTAQLGPPRHRMFAIEYFCHPCKSARRGRFFKKPDKDDLSKLVEVENMWRRIKPTFVPKDRIPPGDETDRLHKWGYQFYREMFNPRQLLGLELSCRAIAGLKDERVRNALATNLSDLLRYQNMLCRYDTMALKSLDIFSVHGFPVGLIQCESNLLGITNDSSGAVVGSGGWVNIISKYSKAKAYCDEPFEIQLKGSREVQVPIVGEWIGDQKIGAGESEKRRVSLKCKSGTLSSISARSLDAVLTDPPYFGNVQYAELMDFCYVWLRQLLGATEDAFKTHSTRNSNELTGNLTLDRGLPHFTEGLSKVFIRMAKALKLGSPLAFTYHHNTLEAYYPIAVAILDSGLTCSASIPCPAEMGASIHINGTGSSIIDTVFVCRSHGKLPSRWIVKSAKGIASLVSEDISKLLAGNVTATRGDIRCIIFGHLIRMAVWNLRKEWDRTRPVKDKLSEIASQTMSLGGLETVEKYLGDAFRNAQKFQNAIVRESDIEYRTRRNEISF